MDLEYFTKQMARNAESIRSLATGISDEQSCWKPDPASWSILEVINHLYDEEKHDFRVRLDYILHRPGESWPAIDPAGWVTSRQYNQREPVSSLENFLRERAASLVWLRGLDGPDWQKAEQAPFGPFHAGDMFAAWVAHDLLHLRQLVELHWAWTTRSVQPYQPDYAGEW